MAEARAPAAGRGMNGSDCKGDGSDSGSLLKLDNYLQQQVSSHSINQAASETYKNAAYEFIAAFGPNSGVPDACPGPDGQMIYYWRKDSDSIQLDVKPNGDAELYYRNTNGDFLIEYKVGTLLNKLALFAPFFQGKSDSS